MPIYKVLFSFRGRITRRQYWLKGWLALYLAALLLTVVLAMLPWASIGLARLYHIWLAIGMVLSTWVFLAIVAKRLRDLNRSGWWALWLFVVALVPLVGLGLVIVLGCLRTKEPENPAHPPFP